MKIEAYREHVYIDNEKFEITVPKELVHTEVDIVVIPVATSARQEKQGEDMIDYLMRNPIQLEKGRPLTREEIYAGRIR